MNITGGYYSSNFSNGSRLITAVGGAFSVSGKETTHVAVEYSATNQKVINISFDASKSWTGEKIIKY